MKFLNTTTLKLSVLSLAVVTASANAQDARSLAMGGTGIINGKGAAGALQNPAILAKQKDDGLRGSFIIGGSVAVHDRDSLIDDVKDVDDFANVIDTEADKFNNKVLPDACKDPNAPADTVCVEGLDTIIKTAEQASGLMNSIDGKPLEIDVDTKIGFSYLGTTIPFAVNVDVNSTAATSVKVDEEDKKYFDGFHNGLPKTGELTVGDLKKQGSKFVNENGKLVVKNDKDYNPKSTGEGIAVAKAQVAVSLAKGVNYNDDTVYLGLTPKVVQLATSNVSIEVDKDGADSDKAQDTLQDSKDNLEQKTTGSLDAGMLFPIEDMPGFSVGATITDIVPYSIETKDSESNTRHEIKTEPQVTAGFGYANEYVNVATELAVNPADKDGIETQPVGLGAEVNFKWFALRAGVAHDLAQKDSTSYSLGVDLGFIELGAKVNNEQSAEVAAQIAFEF